jgi:hypothetical protein
VKNAAQRLLLHVGRRLLARATAWLFASAYSVKAAKTNMPINVATATAMRARKNLVIQANAGTDFSFRLPTAAAYSGGRRAPESNLLTSGNRNGSPPSQSMQRNLRPPVLTSMNCIAL